MRCLVAVVLAVTAVAPAQAQGTEEPTVVIAVRHAERADQGPGAETAGVVAEEYDPRRMADFVADLRGMGGVVVVVGHSNTTPGVVEALGGDPVSPIAEPEYERLYTVFLAGDAVQSTVVAFCPAG